MLCVNGELDDERLKRFLRMKVLLNVLGPHINALGAQGPQVKRSPWSGTKSNVDDLNTNMEDSFTIQHGDLTGSKTCPWLFER